MKGLHVNRRLISRLDGMPATIIHSEMRDGMLYWFFARDDGLGSGWYADTDVDKHFKEMPYDGWNTGDTIW